LATLTFARRGLQQAASFHPHSQQQRARRPGESETPETASLVSVCAFLSFLTIASPY